MNFTINRHMYLNTGVILYTKAIRQYFSDENIEKYHRLFESIYPNQAYNNYIIQAYSEHGIQNIEHRIQNNTKR